jgi:hypothetical protein
VTYTERGAVDVNRKTKAGIHLVKFGCMVFVVEGSQDMVRDLDTELQRLFLPLFLPPDGLELKCHFCAQVTKSFATYVWHQQAGCKMLMDTPIEEMWNPSFPMFLTSVVN